VRPSNSFQWGRVRLLRLSPIAIHYESQLDTPPFDPHRDKARDGNASVTRSLRRLSQLSWQLEREAKSVLCEINPIDQRGECRRRFDGRFQAMTPCPGVLKNLRDPVRGYLRALDGIQNGFFVIEDLPCRDRNDSLDLSRRQ
jgi:hypothetical protein